MSELYVPPLVMGVVLAMLVILAGMMAYRASNSEKSKFALDEAFLDSNGKTSMARICTFVALMVSTWGFAYMVQSGKIVDWYVTAYLTAFVVNGVGSKYIDTLKKDPIL